MPRSRIHGGPLVVAIMVSLLAGARSVADDASGPAGSDVWPVYRGDTHSTGAARSELPATLELVWSTG